MAWSMRATLLPGCFFPRLLPPYLSRPRNPHATVTHLCSRIVQFSSTPQPRRMPPAAHIELSAFKILIGAKELVIIQPKDVDEVLDFYIKQGRLDGDPYWCRIWPSSVVLAEEVLLNPELVAGLCVCDLGAGLGLAGLAAALGGAKQVVFHDQESLALLCSLLSILANIPQAATNLSNVLRLVFPEIDWSSGGMWDSPLWKSAVSLPIFSHCVVQFEGFATINEDNSTAILRAEQFNWSSKEVPMGSFDVVLASDVLYDKNAVPLVARSLPGLLRSRKLGKLIVTDPTQRTPDNRQRFLRLLSDSPGCQGFKLEKIETRTSTMDGKSHDVEFMLFTSTVMR